MSDPVTEVTTAVDHLADELDRLVAACTDPEARDLAEFLVTVQDARKALQDVERDLEDRTARAMLSDYAESADLRVERSRAADRTKWDHDGWKRDVRAKVLRKHGLAGAQGVLDANGEVLPPEVLHELLAGVQGVHGSAAPKTGPTGLRGLGMDPADYCESSPGRWAVKVTRMADETKGGTSDAA